MKNKRPTWKEIIAFAVGDGGCNLVWTTIGSYLTLYYTDSVGLAAADNRNNDASYPTAGRNFRPYYGKYY